MARQQDMQGGLDDIEKLLKEGKTEEALARLQQLQAQMSEMQKRLDESAESMGGRANPELVKRYREFSDALKNTTEEQRQLAEETKAVRDRYREQMRQRMKQAAAGLKETLQKKADQVAQDYLRVGPNDLSPRADQPLEQAKSELENLKSALKSEDFDLAAEAAQRAVRQAEELARAGEQQRALDEVYQNPPDVREKSRRLAQRLEKDADTVRDDPPEAGVSSSRRSRSQLGQADRQKLQELGQGQQKLESARAGPAAADGRAGADGAAVRRAGRGGAAADLRPHGRGRRAAGGQGPAAAATESRRQRWSRSSSSSSRCSRASAAAARAACRCRCSPAVSRRAATSSAGRRWRSRTRTPYGAPKEFRKDLLDAMKQGAPEKLPGPGEALLRGAGEVRRAAAALPPAPGRCGLGRAGGRARPGACARGAARRGGLRRRARRARPAPAGARRRTSRSTYFAGPGGLRARAATRTRSRRWSWPASRTDRAATCAWPRTRWPSPSDHERAESDHFIFLYPKGKDEVLAPYALETLEAQRAALEKDLGHAPPGKVRVEVVNDAAELARVSTLTQKQIRTRPAPSPSASSTS